MASQDPQQLVDSALECHQRGDLDAAEGLYRRVLETIPGQAQVRHLLASLLLQQGRIEEAEREFGQVIALDPEIADAHHNLGIVYQKSGRVAEAIRSYERATELDPESAESFRSLGGLHDAQGDPRSAAVAYHHAIAADPTSADDYPRLAIALCAVGRPEVAVNVMSAHAERFPEARSIEDINIHGYVLAEARQLDEATELFEQGLAQAPDFASLHTNYGSALQQLKRHDEAKHHFGRAIELDPDDAAAHHNLGTVERELGHEDTAAACFRRALELDPSLDVSRHQLAMITGEGDARAPDGYVSDLFDRFSGSYDEQLVDQLAYRVPEQIVEQLESIAPGRTFRAALDLGCGTGLMGVALSDRTETLVGVDLSPGMIEKARQKRVYDALHVGELTRFLESDAAAEHAWDLMVAADVFIYIGDLAPILRAAVPRLATDGTFIFSTETSDDPGYRVTATGRYVHHPEYVRDIAAAAGLSIARRVDIASRTENQQPVRADLYVLTSESGSP